jgi:hypothetical protein
MTAPRRFPQPWSIEERQESFVVKDANGQQLAYLYFEDEPQRQMSMKRLSHDEARQIAVNFAKLPDLLQQPLERRASMVMVVKAVLDAHRALADLLAAEHPDAKATINALFGVLDNPEMVAALRALASEGPRLFPGEPESDEGQ